MLPAHSSAKKEGLGTRQCVHILNIIDFEKILESNSLQATTCDLSISISIIHLNQRRGLVSCPHQFCSLLQNLEEHTYSVLLMERVWFNQELAHCKTIVD